MNNNIIYNYKGAHCSQQEKGHFWEAKILRKKTLLHFELSKSEHYMLKVIKILAKSKISDDTSWFLGHWV